MYADPDTRSFSVTIQQEYDREHAHIFIAAGHYQKVNLGV